MLEEQLETIRLFREHYDPETVDKFVIYGTGIHAEAVVKSCGDYPIVGLMDASKTGQNFWGQNVLSEEEVLNLGVRLVVVIARPAVLGIIYRRIRPWSEKHGIRIQDIRGNTIADRVRKNPCESPYFKVSYESLINEIDTHEIISFDIFDTVLIRKVYEPADVFLLLDMEAEEKLPIPFSVMRKETEQELLKEGEPDLYQIYERMGKTYHLTRKMCDVLMDRELKKEQEVLTVRCKMKECIEYCKEKKKRIFFVSDMYLPAEILKGFLNQFGITGYEEILVSCEYHMSKINGLFQILKEKAEGKSCLHIGDNEERDYKAARKSGIDAFLIMPAVRMLELSTWKNALMYLDGIESRVMVGMLAAEAFNDPFALYASYGKPGIFCPQKFGSLFIAPLVVSYTVWMLQILKSREKDLLLFASRDGWLPQKIYHMLKEQWKLKNLPRDIYFMISRKALLEIEKERDGEAGDAYLRYLEDLDIRGYDNLYFFDFMSRGTCQSKLEKLMGRKLVGLYFQKSVSGEKDKDELDVKAYFSAPTAYGSDLRIFAVCDFLECIVTSYQPLFVRVNADGGFVYDRETRSAGQIECLKEIHKGVLDYCRSFSEIIKKIPAHMPAPEFCDELLGYISGEFSAVEIPELKDFVLDDWLKGDKNTGIDALA